MQCQLQSQRHKLEVIQHLLHDKESPAGSIPGSRRSPGKGHGNPLQYSCLENPMDRGAWQAPVPRVAQSRTWLSSSSRVLAQRWAARLRKFLLGKELLLKHSWSGRSPGGGHGNPLQYSCLENPLDRGPWQATVHRVTESQTWLKWFSTHAGGASRQWNTIQC